MDSTQVAGATTILGAFEIVVVTSIVGCYAFQWWAETAVKVLYAHQEGSGGSGRTAEARAAEFENMDVNGDGTIGVSEYIALQSRQKANSLRAELSRAESSARAYNVHVNKSIGQGLALLLLGGGSMSLSCVLITVGGFGFFATGFFGYLIFVCFVLCTVLMVAAAGPGEVHSVSLRAFNTIENYFVDGLSFDLIKIYLSDLEFGMRISGTVVTFSTVVSVMTSLLLTVGLTFWGGA